MLGQERHVAVWSEDVLQEGRVHALEMDHRRVWVRAIDPRDPIEAFGGRNVGLRIHHVVPGEYGVLARQGNAVLKRDVVTKAVGEGKAVLAHVAVGNRRYFAQRIRDRSRFRIVTHRKRHREHCDIERRRAAVENDVERLDVLVFGEPQHAGTRPTVAPGGLNPFLRTGTNQYRRKYRRDRSRQRPHALPPVSASRIASGSMPTLLQNSRYACGAISEGLISLRPPQNTLVYEKSIPDARRCSSIAALCSRTRCFSMPCATA